MRKLLLIALLSLPMLDAFAEPQQPRELVYNLPGGQVEIVLSTTMPCPWAMGYLYGEVHNTKTGGFAQLCYVEQQSTYQVHIKQGDSFAYDMFPKTKFKPIIDISFEP